MAFIYPTFEQQQAVFDYIRLDIDRDLREAGIDAVIAAQGQSIPEAGNAVIDGTFDKLVVARHIGYSTALADVSHDLDPFATRMTVDYEVGVRHEQRDGQRLTHGSYTGFLVSQSIFQNPHEAVGVGLELTESQLEVVADSVARLIRAKSRAFLPFLTKSLLKLDLAGD